MRYESGVLKEQVAYASQDGTIIVYGETPRLRDILLRRQPQVKVYTRKEVVPPELRPELREFLFWPDERVGGEPKPTWKPDHVHQQAAQALARGVDLRRQQAAPQVLNGADLRR